MSDVIKRVQIVFDDAPPQTVYVDDSSEVCLTLRTTFSKQLVLQISRRYERNQKIYFIQPEQKTLEL